MELRTIWAELRANLKSGDDRSPLQRTPNHLEQLKIASEAFEAGRITIQQKRAAIARQGDDITAHIQAQERAQIAHVSLLKGGVLDQWIEPTARMLTSRGYTVDRDSDWFQRLVEKVAETTIASIDLANREARGDLSAEPSSRVLADARRLHGDAAMSQHDLSFSDLADAFMRQWLASASNRKRTNTEQQKRAIFKLFAGFCGDGPIRGIRQQDAATFRDTLKLFDPNWARSPASRRMDWEQLVQKFGDRPRGLSAATMNRHIRALQSLWEWARRRGHCEGDNPFAGFHVKLKPGVNVEPYAAWSNDELRQLFERPPTRTDVLEIMIVAMFSGMRLDEIASLTWGHVRQSEEDGRQIHYFRVDDAKTAAGIRDVPVHPALGWLLRRARQSDHVRLWPGFNEEGVGKKPGADAGREFSRFKMDRGFLTRTKTFHSFRKNVTRIMERAQVHENEWAQVFGHERGFTYSVYNPDGISLARKAAIIALIDYPGVPVPHPN